MVEKMMEELIKRNVFMGIEQGVNDSTLDGKVISVGDYNAIKVSSKDKASHNKIFVVMVVDEIPSKG